MSAIAQSSDSAVRAPMASASIAKTASAHATVAGSPKEVAEQSDVVITMAGSALGTQRLLHAMRDRSVLPHLQRAAHGHLRQTPFASATCDAHQDAR